MGETGRELVHEKLTAGSTSCMLMGKNPVLNGLASSLDSQGSLLAGKQ